MDKGRILEPLGEQIGAAASRSRSDVRVSCRSVAALRGGDVGLVPRGVGQRPP
jgi:hypothetical protein